MKAALEVRPGALKLPDLRRFWAAQGTCSVRLDPAAWSAVDRSRAAVARIVGSGRTVYGVNTGFGLLAQVRIPSERLLELQRRLLLSHACGVGEPLSDRVVRLMLLLKVASLARGASGVSQELVKALLRFLEADALPVVPAQGSVGASGDLAPLAHLCTPLLGVGQVTLGGHALPAREVLARLNLEPLELGPKEGLALINGTQASTALALDALFRVEQAFAAACVAGMLSVDALMGSDAPFDPRIHQLRGHAGAIDVARLTFGLLQGSQIRASHAGCDKVQDPYSLRCQPQVMGACLDVMRSVAQTLEIEANAVTDNPLIFDDGEEPEALSGGNFHAEPVAFAADALTNAACEVASLSERRIALLIDPKMSGLPAFLVKDGGVNSGFMIAHVTAAALVSENRTSAHPASVDTIPTSANQEDHVSMATHGARRAVQVARNTSQVVGVELLTAAQALEFHAPLQTSAPLRTAVERIRERVPPCEEDRYFADDLYQSLQLVENGAFMDLAGSILPSAPI